MSKHQIRNRLLRKQSELAERLAQLRSDIAPEEGGGYAGAERALAHENDEVADRLASSTVADLGRVDAALARVSAGNYGLCEFCAEVIDDERLRAVPLTTLCADCARDAEDR